MARLLHCHPAEARSPVVQSGAERLQYFLPFVRISFPEICTNRVYYELRDEWTVSRPSRDAEMSEGLSAVELVRKTVS